MNWILTQIQWKLSSRVRKAGAVSEGAYYVKTREGAPLRTGSAPMGHSIHHRDAVELTRWGYYRNNCGGVSDFHGRGRLL